MNDSRPSPVSLFQPVPRGAIVFKIEALVWVSFQRALKFQPFDRKVGSNPKTSIQERRNEIQNSYFICACIIRYMFPVQCEELKNQPSNFTSCSDNTLRLMVPLAGRLYWGLQVTSSFSIWGCVLKGYFERGIFWRVKSRLKGIEDFLQSWTLPGRFLGRDRVKILVLPSRSACMLWSIFRCVCVCVFF